MIIYKLLYQSRSRLDAFADDSKNSIIDILNVSRRRNAAAGVTGCLAFNENIFMQILEGEERAVKETFGRIRQDSRHDEVTILFAETVDSRRFGTSSMAFAGASKPAQSRYHDVVNDNLNWLELSSESKCQLMLDMMSIDEEEMLRDHAIEKLARSVNLIARGWRDRLDDALSSYNLSLAAAEPLIWLARAGGSMRQGDLAGRIGVESNSLTRIMMQLEAKNLIEQRDDVHDRRVKVFQLTEDGSRVAGRAADDLMHIRSQIMQNVPEADVEDALRILSAIELGLSQSKIKAKQMTDQ